MKRDNELLIRICRKKLQQPGVKFYGQSEFLLLRVIDSAGSNSIFAENVLNEFF
jgi:hypothetical protein